MAEDTQTQTKDVRDDNGRWLAPPPGSENTRITTANARTMAQRRWENYRRAAVRAIVEEAKSIDSEASTGANAFGLVAAKQYSALMDSDKPRIADLEKLGQIMTGMVASSQRENAAAPGETLISAPPEALMHLVDLIERQRSAAVDRARAVDVDATDTRNE